uniref:Phosphoinositide phospholipase C n=1 Tax=Romanomermis culicivorax TaxID=13658 RepID=A0A915KXF7_ROMCU
MLQEEAQYSNMLEEDQTLEPNFSKKVVNGDIDVAKDPAFDDEPVDVCQKPCSSTSREDSLSFAEQGQRMRNYSDSNSLTPILKSSLSKGSGSLQKSPRASARKKVVSFSSEPTEKKICSANDCLSFMQIGSNLIKVKSATRRYQRYFSLESDFSCLRWSPTMKKVDKARISVDSIKEIRIGRNTENLRNSDSCFEDYTEDCAFSIIWGDDYQHLDLIANTPDEANIWITGLVALTSGIGNEQPTTSSEMTTTTVRDKMLEKFFDDHLQELQQCGDEDEKMIELLLKLNPRLPRSKILHKQKEFEYYYRLDGALKSSLRKREFCEVYRYVSTRPEIYFLLVRYANKDYLTADDLQIFLETEQGIAGATLELCHSLIKIHEPFEYAAMAGKMTVDGFTNYLLSPECHLFDQPVHGKVCQDMTQPFTNYFISCSNNTYLAEDQLKGPSSVQAFINALKLGCRFIELDVWESEEGTSDEPVVCHGHTMTTKLSIRKALSAIKQYAFYTSQYPLVVQIENHLNIEYQKKFAFLLQSVFGDLLYVSKNDTNFSEENQRLPAPESFKNKILLKGKRLDEEDSTQGQVSDEDESAENNRSARAMKKSQSFVKRRTLCKELSDLICPFLQSFNVSDFPTILDRQKWYQLGSLNESFALKLSAHYSQDFVVYTQKFLTRVYPNSVRIDSSNMNPQEFWNCGCQLVALNFQTPGLMMDLARGKFSANGRSGYVLKPLTMRDVQANFSPRGSLNSCNSQTLHIKIISAQQLRRPRGSTAKGDSLDPFVIVEVFGLPCDCAEERTKTVQNNSFNPVFDESFQFDVSLAELALVRFLVLDDDYIADDFIGQYTIPFECLQS